jgi:hypothetical protein
MKWGLFLRLKKAPLLEELKKSIDCELLKSSVVGGTGFEPVTSTV